MAAATGEGGKQQFPSVADGNGNAPVKYPSFKAPKLSFSDGPKHNSIDVFPLLVKEADHGIKNSLVQDVCTISVLPDEGNTIPQCTSQFTLLSFVKTLFPSKNHMLIDAQLNCQKTQNRINVLLGGTDSYQSCVVDINVEKGNGAEAEEVVASLKSESVHMQKVLQRQASLSTDKAISERCHDAPTNRWRRYKRAASFDSRKIVILFSILSSVGTLILIYLTLRVRLINGDNSFNHM
ncbi:hypothetical protein HID58_093353 [Brassica napus]|uniref:BnaC03g76520D protein n=2 Tax=Brassica napus TaxID=3708 RepID=A0A078J803_BRANA|nr:uncharacterized protein BNAC03G76520D isoform X2 [Brassica napus]XP_048627725.1 uncharacterized protein LOC125596713 isoform X2 [Brassica napus]KAH0853268.1 hypothetical protein HID58_093353 [Brassica napus]CAF1710123.1 unnamed protein product [Brassica napus]CDY59444.1 BnaC03g76520D [Brassica napus]